MNRYRARTIDERGGLRQHHQDYEPILGINFHAMFIYLIEKGLNDTAIGKALDKNRATIHKWRLQLSKERGTIPHINQNQKD